MTRFEWTTIVLQLITLGFASYFAYIQNEINVRQAEINDYVSVSAIPDQGGIRFLNTGATNVYIEEVDVDASSTKYEPPRQIAAKAGDASSYFLPIDLTTANEPSFTITLKLKDEFGQEWVSEHGGGAADTDTTQGRFSVWTYRTKPAH